MKFLKRLAGGIATLALAVSMSSVATPAHALPGDVTLTFAPTAVLGDIACIEHAFTYAVELPEGTTNWNLNVGLNGPDGATVTNKYFGTVFGSQPSGSDQAQICTLDGGEGTYTFTSRLDYKVGDQNTVWGTDVVEGTFEVVGKATSKVKLKAKRKGKNVTATAKVAVTMGSTTGPVGAGGKVIFQKAVGKKWKKVAKGKTDASGLVQVKFRGKKGDRIRAKFAGAGETTVGGGGPPVPAATSKAIRVR